MIDIFQPDEIKSLFDRRNQDLPGYSYKLAESNMYGMDAAFMGEPDINESEMSVVIPFADGNRRDGVGDLLNVEGIDTSRHRGNPVILYDHGKKYEMPVALAEDPKTREYTVYIDPIAKVATAKAFFYQGKEAYLSKHAEFCEQLFDMIAKRYIRAGSIGYQIKRGKALPEVYETGTPSGMYLESVLMLECSAVVLPANGDTVRKSYGDSLRELLCKDGCCGRPLHPILVKSFEPFATPLKTQMLIDSMETKGRWVTIGGGPCKDPKKDPKGKGGQHCGGTRVYINSSGEITRGPRQLEGRHVGGNQTQREEINQGRADGARARSRVEPPRVKPPRAKPSPMANDQDTSSARSIPKPPDMGDADRNMGAEELYELAKKGDLNALRHELRNAPRNSQMQAYVQQLVNALEGSQSSQGSQPAQESFQEEFDRRVAEEQQAQQARRAQAQNLRASQIPLQTSGTFEKLKELTGGVKKPELQIRSRSSKPVADVKRGIKKLFGDNVDFGVLGAGLNVVSGNYPASIDVHDGVLRSNYVDVENGIRATRTIRRDENGDLIAHNDYFSIEKNSPYRGQGIEIFANQVQAMRELGVKKLETFAAGNWDDAQSGGFNGYYTWARMGYDGTIDHHTFSQLPKEIRNKMGSSRSVQDVMALPGGKEAWQRYGGGFTDGVFDLTPGSRSMKVLEAYIAERNSETPEQREQRRARRQANKHLIPSFSTMHIDTKSMDEEKWTTVRGARVVIDDDGKVVKGPKALKGKTLKNKVPLRNLPNTKTPPAKWKPGAGAMKSNLMESIRKKYRTTKSLRRRLKKSATGASICYVKAKDMDSARADASAKGLEFFDMGSGKNIGGVHKVKLSGSDPAIDDFVKMYGVPLRAAKSLPVQEQANMQHKKKALMAEGVSDEADTGGKVEPYGAQVLRRVHEDHSILMKDYDEMMDILEEQGVKGHLMSTLQNVEKYLTETEKAFAKIYKDLPGLGTQAEGEDHPPDEVFEEDGMDEDENTDMDTMDDNAVGADSDLEELPPPEDAVEGMHRKALNVHRRATKEIRAKYRKEEKSMCAKCGKSPCACGAKAAKCSCGKCMEDPYTGQPGPCPGTPKKDPNKLQQEEKDIPETEVQEMNEETNQEIADAESNPTPEPNDAGPSDDQIDDDLLDHQKGFAREAGDYLDELSKTRDYTDEHRMKSYHYHKLLDFADNNVNVPVGGAVVGGNKGKAMPGEPGWEEEEAMEPEHQQVQEGMNDTYEPDPAVGDAQEAELNPPMQETKGMKRRKGCKDASKLFKDLSRTRDFGEPHRIKCAVMAKCIKDLMVDDSPVQDVPEEEAPANDQIDPNMMGEMGEKHILALKKMFDEQDRQMAAINERVASLLAI